MTQLNRKAERTGGDSESPLEACAKKLAIDGNEQSI